MPRTITNPITREWLALIFLLALPFLIHAPGLLGFLSEDPIYSFLKFGPLPEDPVLPGFPGWLDPNSGATTQALGASAARQWLSGHVPWWDSYSGIGMPMAAEMQSSALFFPFVLLLSLPNGLVLLKIAMQCLAGFAMYGLAREMRLSFGARIVVSTLMECSGTFAWFSHGPIMPVPFLPMLVWGIMRCGGNRDAGRRWGWLLVALGIGGSIIAGFPETAFLDGLLALVIAIWRIGISRHGLPTALHIIGGGLLGVLLSAPAWVPFILLIRNAYLGQNSDIGTAHADVANAAMLLFPYLLGPPQFAFFVQANEAARALWWHTSAYCDFTLILAALVGLAGAVFSSRRTGSVAWRGLRVVLGLYLLMTGMKVFGIQPGQYLMDMIPGIRQTMTHIYIGPSWWFALSLLAGLAFDDTRTAAKAAVRHACVLTFVPLAVTSVLVVSGARSAIAELWTHGHHYHALVAWSFMWAVTTATLLLWGFWKSGKSGRVLVGMTLSVNSVVLFSVPLLCGVKPVRSDESALSALRHLTRLQRVLSLNALAPNYGAYYGIASINYTYLPVPRNFANEIAAHAISDGDPTQYIPAGLSRSMSDTPEYWQNIQTIPQLGSGQTLEWLRKQSVGFIVARNGTDVWRDRAASSIGPGSAVPVPLGTGTVRGQITLPAPGKDGKETTATIRKIGVSLGTYQGASRGRIEMSLCASDDCVTATGELDRANDNRLTWLDLSHPLTVSQTGERTLDVTIRGSQTDRPAALWMWPARQRQAEHIPFFAVDYNFNQPGLETIYSDPYVFIQTIPGAAPYFSAPGCIVKPTDRNALSADCPVGTTLVRHELYAEHWRATLNGASVPVGMTEDGLHQTVTLPPGKSAITFDYRPPGYRLLCTLFGLGLAGCAGWLMMERRRQRL